jgi:glutamate-1-semialdehyde 2,1-aminomutase
MLLGHSLPIVVEAVREQIAYSSSFGTPTLLEIEMAELIKEMVPGCDLIRMVNSGTEACMSAIRVARGYTNRNKIIKFEGCYHGHADPFLVKAGSGLATLEISSVPGVPNGVAADTLICPYNDLKSVKQMVGAFPAEIAAIILEPVAGNMGCVPPATGFLDGLRRICDKEGIILIFDEVMTGFRLSTGGAQDLFGVEADLVTFGKIIGAGFPVGAFGGKQKYMEMVAPVGKVYQAGTLSGNPIAMRAGITLLRVLKDNPEVYDSLERKGKYLQEGLHSIGKEVVPFIINRIGSMISLHFTRKPVVNFASSAASETGLFRAFFHSMLKRGIYLPPSAFESWFLSEAMTYTDLDRTIEAASESFKELGWT